MNHKDGALPLFLGFSFSRQHSILQGLGEGLRPCLRDDGLKAFVLNCACVLCICVCVHLCPCGHACAHVGGYTRKPEINVRCLLQTRSSVFFEMGVFHKTWSSPIWLN